MTPTRLCILPQRNLYQRIAFWNLSLIHILSVLNGKGARAEFTGITFAGAGQNLDTGTKVVHNAPETTSYINTKSISKDGGISTFRSSVVVKNSAAKSKSAVSRCV